MKRKPAKRHALRRKSSAKKSAAKNPAHSSRRPNTSHPLPHSLSLGLSAIVEREVPFEWTIAAYDARLPTIFSTPAMIGLMEIAAALAIRPHLPEGFISVGTRIEVDHLKAVPQGTLIQARARLSGNEERFLMFEVEALAGELLVGRGKVYRAIIDLARFQK
ncbi:MAG TPA: hotdog domain-containing protein [Candidatus Acidoferrales bacterium]|nr:hotdog domain-containing protein [Candidatus Acidoferrales bacterium]